MAQHQYQNIDVDVNTHVQYGDVDSGYIGPFKKERHSTNAFMALLRLDMSLGTVQVRSTINPELVYDTLTPGFDGDYNFGDPCEVEEMWVGFQLSDELCDKLTKEQIDYLLLGIYICTDKGEHI